MSELITIFFICELSEALFVRAVCSPESNFPPHELWILLGAKVFCIAYSADP